MKSIPLRAPYEVRRSKPLAEKYEQTHEALIAFVCLKVVEQALASENWEQAA